MNLFKVKSNLNAKAAINLVHLGINTVVLTTVGEIDEMMEEFITTPDRSWCNGLGKEYLFNMLMRKLKVKDEYFTNNPKKIKPSNPKWVDFCNDCLILFTLDAALNGNVVRLVHPDQYKKFIKNTTYNGTTGAMPDYIEGIPSMQ